MRRLIPQLMLVVALGVTACTDGPASPVVQQAALVEPAHAQDGQIAGPGADVGQAPSVVVRDGRGAPVAGITVRFAVTKGEGSVGASSVVTGTSGEASAGRWTLGPAAGVNEVTATVGALPPVRFTATAVADGPTGPVAPAASSFDIAVRYVSGTTLRQRQSVDRAIERWRSVIVGKLPSVYVNAPAGTCFATQPAINELVDDLLILVEFVEIDGPGKVLGEAGPCYIRTESGLPILGQLRLDSADLEQMERAGTLDDVVLHEIGHVLGFGTLWPRHQLVDGSGGADPHFTGTHAIAAYHEMGGTLPGVPVENTGSTGTRDGHWRESVFGNELMTGYIAGTPNPLSRLTVGSLRDLGYNASHAGASSYTLGSTMYGVVTQPVDLRGRERIVRPRVAIDRSGRRRPLD